MNKVGIVTLHNYNYGSALQCFATQTILQSQGYEPWVIEEENDCGRRKAMGRRLWTIAKVVAKSPADVHSIWKILKSSTAKSLRLSRESKAAIQDFVNSELHIHRATGLQLRDEALSDEWTFYLSGSDQVWGGSAIEGRELSFLRFAPMNKRIAWASSFGSNDIARYNKRLYTQYIAQYAKISVRESSGASLVYRYANRHAEVLCDPVFLIPANKWREYGQDNVTPKDDYLLVFFIDEPSVSAIEYIKKACEVQKLTPVSFGYRYAALEQLPHYIHYDGGPFEFISFIDKAKIVATDSFHALSFSSILHSPCEVFDRQYQHNHNQNTRIVDFKDAVEKAGGIDLYIAAKQKQALAYLNGLHDKKCYIAACTDKKLIDKSASGGMFAMLAQSVLREGGIVYGAAMCNHDGHLQVKHIAVDRESELWRLQGSKYVESYTKGIHEHVKQQLDEGRDVLFSGTSCQIAALKAFLKKDYPNLLTVDLVCHGVPKAEFLDNYIAYLEKQSQKKIVDFSFRDRHLRPYYQITVTFEDGTTEKIPLRDSSYYRIFMSRCGYRKACYACHYASVEKPADITLADYALSPRERLEYGFQDAGLLSSMIVHTTKGEEALANHRQECILHPLPLQKMMDSHQQLQHPSIPENKKWWNLYQQGGFELVEKKMAQRNRMIMIPRSIIGLFKR